MGAEVLRVERRCRGLMPCVRRAGVRGRVRWPLTSGAARGRRGDAVRHSGLVKEVERPKKRSPSADEDQVEIGRAHV